jgi:pimeloyl-ACP methyl ester carboxylesterase
MKKTFLPFEKHRNIHSSLFVVLLLLLFSTLISACRIGPPTGNTVVSRSARTTRSYEKTHCFVSLPQGAVEGKDVVCGYVTVPQYHTHPGGKTLRLAVTVTKSTNPHPDPTPLVMAQGGPGGSSIDDFLGMSLDNWMADIRAQRDIVIVNYRGTNYSQPFLSCSQSTALSDCLSSFTRQGYDLSAFNSVEIAADYPTVLQALGYKQFHFYGVSYGTEIGQYLMREAPESLRSVVLDSIVSMNMNYNLTGPNTADRDFRLIFKSCATNVDCQRTYPHLEQTFFNLVDRLNTAPVMLPVSTTSGIFTEPLSGSMLISVFWQEMYRNTFIPEFPQVVFDMAKGDYTSIQPLISDSLAQGNDPTMAGGLYTTVYCAEYPDVTQDDYHIQGLYPEVAAAMSGTTSSQCQTAKVKSLDSSVHQPVVSNIPVLALSGAFDPITPPEFADIAIAKMSHAIHYTFPAEGHGVISNACAMSLITNFVADPQQKPEDDCFQQQKPPAFGKAITLIPYTAEQQGFSTVIPNNWQNNAYGGFSDFYATRNIDFSVSHRSMTIDDILSQYGADPSQEKVLVGQRASHGMTWKLYLVQGTSTTYIALATTKNSTYIIMVSAYSQDFEQLVTDLFYPAIDAFQVK